MSSIEVNNIVLHETELKEKLQAFARNKFRPSEKDDLSEIIPAMLNFIGTTDSDLRDELIYSAFATWITRDNALTPEQLHDLLPIILDERHLLYKIGEHDTDSVFTRSFSMLVLPLLLISHHSQPLFSASEINQIKEKLLYYLEHEKDRRGFVPEKGWAHAIAHTSDALDDLAQCAEMDKSDLVEILGAIRNVICIESAYYAYSEEERMVTAVLAVFRRDLLSDVEIAQWIEGFSDLVLAVHSGPKRHILRGNTKNFLQSLYFRLQWEQAPVQLDDPIKQTLRKINPYVKSES